MASMPPEECAHHLGAPLPKRMSASWSGSQADPTGYKVAARGSRALAGSPRFVLRLQSCHEFTALNDNCHGNKHSRNRPPTAVPRRGPHWLPSHCNSLVTEDRATPRGRKSEGEYALSNAERQARHRGRLQHSSQGSWSNTASRWIGGAGPGAGTTPSPKCSWSRPNVPHGSMRCPRTSATVPPEFRYRRSSISTSMLSPKSSRLAAISEAMQENGISRIYGGWHYSFDNTAALEMGTDVGNTVFADAFTVPEPPAYACFTAGIIGLIVMRGRHAR
jgi:hypothetical protein